MEATNGPDQNPWSVEKEDDSLDDQLDRQLNLDIRSTPDKATQYTHSQAHRYELETGPWLTVPGTFPSDDDSESERFSESDTVICGACEDLPGELYCEQCEIRYCENCWRMQAAHKKKSNANSEGHWKTSYANHAHYQKILNPKWSDEKRTFKHHKDMASVWFYVASDDESHKSFSYLPRFRNLVTHYQEEKNLETCNPRLVSFVGTTGAGKSTLIRMMLEKPWLTDNDSGSYTGKGPIVGEKNSTVPTSGDVHLYADSVPENDMAAYPVFYADCEGFHGGAVAPAGSLSQAKKLGQLGKKAVNRVIDFLLGEAQNCALRQSDHASAEQGKSPTRNRIVKNLFPKLLYNFSDLVIFVVKEPRTLGERMVDILKWASSSAASAINRATLPGLVVVINNEDEGADWDPQTMKRRFFDENKRMMTEDPNIIDLCKPFTSRGMSVETLEALISMHYASIDFICVPNGQIRYRLSAQLETLSTIVQGRTGEAQMRKHNAGMLLSSQDQELFFQLAFAHFADNLDTNQPFDFLAKILQLNPMPNDIPNNLSKLFAVVYKSASSKVTEGAAKEFIHLVAPLVSSAIALNAIRSNERLPGRMSEVFRGGSASDYDAQSSATYENQVGKAIDLFCDARRCQFVNENMSKPKGQATPGAFIDSPSFEWADRELSSEKHSQCVLSSLGHQVEYHQDLDGNAIGTGAFKSEFVEAVRAHWGNAVLEQLDIIDEYIKELMSPPNLSLSQSPTTRRPIKPKDEIIWDIHHRNLRNLFNRLPHLGIETSGIRFLCFFCLLQVPDDLLPCGHAICKRCVKTMVRYRLFVHSNDRRLVSLEKCPLHQEVQTFKPALQLQMKPPFSGVRILTLDGGGIRGIIELTILQAVQKELGGKIPIQRFFDLIGGTSIGGIIALSMGIQDMRLDQCVDSYVEFCKAAFTKHGSAWSGDTIPYLWHGHLYQDRPIEEHLTNLLGAESFMGLYHKTPMALKNRIFVTSAREEGSRPTIFTNYIRAFEDSGRKTFYDYEMRWDQTFNFKTWEIARASSAAPGYFAPFRKGPFHTYWDGGLYHNNPAQIARAEMSKIWPKNSNLHPDILLSIGSGYTDKELLLHMPRAQKGIWGMWSRITGWCEKLGILETIGALKRAFLQSLDSELAWQENFAQYKLQKDIAVAERYFRLNPRLQALPDLDDVAALQSEQLVEEATNYILKFSSEVKAIARRLIATSFYFEPDKPPQTTNAGILFTGHISCRFLDGSPDLGHFLRHLREKFQPKNSDLFVFKLDQPSGYLAPAIDSNFLLRAEKVLEFRIEGIKFLVPKGQERFTIVLEMQGRDFPPSPISGCPWYVDRLDYTYPNY